MTPEKIVIIYAVVVVSFVVAICGMNFMGTAMLPSSQITV